MALSKRRTTKKSKDSKIVEISFSTKGLMKLIGLALIGVLIYILWDILFLAILATLIAVLIDPLADKLEKLHIPRGISVLGVYTIGLGIIALMVVLMVPPVVEQTRGLYEQYKPFIESLPIEDELTRFFLSGEIFTEDLQSILGIVSRSGLWQAYPQILNIMSNAINVIASGILVLVLAFFMVIEEKRMKDMALYLVPKEHKEFASGLMYKIKKRLGGWLRGQLILMLCVFVLVFVSLSILRIPYALVLALVAGLLEAIIYVGPVVATVPAVIVAFSISPLMAGIVLLLYFLIQQIESDLLTPKIMQKMTGLNPVVTILAVVVCYEFFGVIGALLAVPLTMLFSLVVKEIKEYSNI